MEMDTFCVLFVDDEVEFLETLLKRMKKAQRECYGC